MEIRTKTYLCDALTGLSSNMKHISGKEMEKKSKDKETLSVCNLWFLKETMEGQLNKCDSSKIAME